MFPQIAILLTAGAPNERVFGLDATLLQTIGFTALSVAVLAFALSKLLYKPVRNYLQKRADRVNNQLADAEQAVADANELKVKHDSMVKGVEAEKDEILESARKLAVEKRNQIMADAKAEADAAKARAQAQIDMDMGRAEAQMKHAIIEVATAMAEKYVTLSLDKDVHDRLFAEAMAELGEAVFTRHSELEGA